MARDRMRYRYRQGFTDVDFAQQMFSGDYYRWVERALEDWQLEAGLPWRRMLEDLHLGLPAVETRCHYLARIAFQDEFDVEVGLRDLTTRGFVADFEIVNVTAGRLAAYGYTSRRFLDMRTGRPFEPVPAEAMDVFRAGAAATRLAPYGERVAEWERRRAATR
jgi:acyl-CoA thioesterase FadM